MDILLGLVALLLVVCLIILLAHDQRLQESNSRQLADLIFTLRRELAAQRELVERLASQAKHVAGETTRSPRRGRACRHAIAPDPSLRSSRQFRPHRRRRNCLGRKRPL